MVKIELVADDAAAVPAAATAEGALNAYESDYSDEYDAEDEFDLDETLAERIAALKDVIPPKYRASLSKRANSAMNAVRATAAFGGRSLWVITSSTLLLGVPLSLCILSEQQLMEMEKGMNLGDSTNALLAPGAESGFGQAA